MAAGYQPLDGDLTAIAALSGVNVIYYRRAANTWSAVTIGAGLTFSGSTLDVAAAFAPLASPVFTGDPQAPTPATADNDTSIATTAFVKAQGYATSAAVAAGYLPLAGGTLSGELTITAPYNQQHGWCHQLRSRQLMADRRWLVRIGDTAESGSNTGGLYICRYNDAGAYRHAVAINRATGISSTNCKPAVAAQDRVRRSIRSASLMSNPW